MQGQPQLPKSDANTGSALQCVIRNVKDEKFFIGLGRANEVSVSEYHENIPPMIEQRIRRSPFCRQL
jgi:hypothetical protein